MLKGLGFMYSYVVVVLFLLFYVHGKRIWDGQLT